MRLATGGAVIALFLAIDLVLPGSVSWWLKLFLAIPFYAGFLAALEGTMSFCVVHASRGTFDLHEPSGMAFGKSKSKVMVGQEEWRRIDRRKAREMHFEAGLGALVLALLLAFA